ncbi:hypothetical protein EK21DRAFT_28330, partial [Setomelanomma holmii]
PGRPHIFGSRANRETGRVEHTICRCHDPDSHGDAWVFNDPEYARDKQGRMMSWDVAMNSIPNLYGKNAVSRQE